MIGLNMTMPEDCEECPCSHWILKGQFEGMLTCEALEAISRYYLAQSAKEFSEPVDKTKWEVTPQTVNCFFGQQINGIVPGRGRIVFELEKGKKEAIGQADMRFFSYNDFVDLYARQGGYTGTSIWDSKKGGISDGQRKKNFDAGIQASEAAS